MSSWFEQLDLGSLQRELAKSVEEASGIINNVNKLDILNFDAMAEQEEADNLAAEADASEDDEDDHEVAPVDGIAESSSLIVPEVIESETARKKSFIESQRAIQSKMKENSKSIVRKLNYTPDDEIAERSSPADDDAKHIVRVIHGSPSRSEVLQSSPSRRKVDIPSGNASEEGELVEISLNSVENTPMMKGTSEADRITATSAEDESEDNFGTVPRGNPSHVRSAHLSGSMTDDSSHSSYLTDNSRHGAQHSAHESSNSVIPLSKKANKKLAKQQRQQLIESNADTEVKPSIYRSVEPEVITPVVKEAKPTKTKKVKTKAPKNLDFWGVSSTKKTLNFPKSSASSSSSLSAVPATPSALNHTVPPETPGGGFEVYGGTVRFSEDTLTPEKSTTSRPSGSSNNISIGLLSDDTYGSDDLFQDQNSYSSTSAAPADGSNSSSLNSISNTTSALINNFLASRLVSSVTAPSSSSSSSSAAATVNPQSLFTFFDNVDEEVDLESDPILKRVKENQANPNFQRETMAETASAVLARLYAGASQTYSGRVSANASGSSSSGSSGSAGGNDVINNPTIFQIFSTLMGQNPVAPATAAARSGAASPLTPRSEQRQQQVMTRPPPLRVMVGNYIKMSLLYLWDNAFSTNGITVITALLFIYSYFKFQRYGTDAGDR